MKLLIACDMEGISGVCNWDHVNPAHAEYHRFRRVMTGDVNAAIRGAAEAAGERLEEILVADGHWNGTNILVEELDNRARLNASSPSPLSMVEGVQYGVDATLFIGYHARAGSLHAVLDHTWSSTRVANLWINDRVTGEFGLNASVCGHFGVPVLMISGDQTVTAEAREWSPKIRTAVVKRASGRYSASCLPLEKAQALIRQTAFEAVSAYLRGDCPEPLKMETPVQVTLEFFNSNMADSAELLPGAERLDGRRIRFTAPDMLAAYRSARAAVNLAG